MKTLVVLAVACASACTRPLDRLRAPEGCTVGSTRACECKNGETSAQTCQSDARSYDECACERRLAFYLEPPQSVRAGQTFSVHLAAVDSLGAVRPADNARVSVQLSGVGDLQGEVLGRFDEGEIVFTGLAVTALQSDAVVRAVSRGLTADSRAFSVTPGEPHTLAWAAALEKNLSSVPFAQALEVRDAFGNITQPIEPLAVSLSVTDPLVSLSPSVVVVDQGTQVISSLRMVGSSTAVRLVAAAGGLASAISNGASLVAVDPEWPASPVPDSSTSFCGDLVTHTSSAPCDSHPLQDGARISPVPQTRAQGGVIVDDLTGLIWEANEPPAHFDNAASAAAYCASRSVAGVSWRLPTRWELISRLDLGRVNTPRQLVSSSIVYGPTGFVWSVDVNGFATVYADAVPVFGRCVSGPPLAVGVAGAPSEQYAPFASGAPSAVDQRTRLQWQRVGSAPLHTFTDALAYCDALVLDGHDDWRLPSIKELYSLVDVRWRNPALDLNVFPGPQDAELWWSSTALRLWEDPQTVVLDIVNSIFVLVVAEGTAFAIEATDGGHRYGEADHDQPEPIAHCVRDSL